MNFKENEIKRMIIMDHYSKPINKPIIKSDFSIVKRKNNSSCMDDVIISLDIEDSIITSGTFDGIACAITTASTDILIELIKKSTLDKALEIIYKYINMIKDGVPDESLKEAQVFQDAKKQPNRLNCVLMSAELLIEIIEEKNNDI